MQPPPQLPLPFPYQPSYAAGDFLRAASNEPALSWLDRPADWPGGRLALWGEPGCGKTHLLHVWTARVGGLLQPGAGLPEMPELPPLGGLAIDDADRAPEEPLLHLLNAALEARLPVLLAAGQPPARWPVRLPDLASRLRAMTAVEIGPPEDSLLDALLLRLAAERQLDLPPALQDLAAAPAAAFPRRATRGDRPPGSGGAGHRRPDQPDAGHGGAGRLAGRHGKLANRR